MISAVSQHAQWSPATLPRTFRCFHCRGETFVTSHCGTLCLPVTYRVLLNTRLMLCYPWALELSSTIPLIPMCVSGRWLHLVFSYSPTQKKHTLPGSPMWLQMCVFPILAGIETIRNMSSSKTCTFERVLSFHNFHNSLPSPDSWTTKNYLLK